MPERDRHGWVASREPFQHRDVVALSRRRDAPVVVVLGERGVGKSDAMRYERDALLREGARPSFLNLAEVAGAYAREELRRALSSPRHGVHHVLLDGLDDASAHADMDKAICSVLRDLDREARSMLRLRISCRTSRWPTLVQSCLQELWGRAPLKVGVAGLTREDALLAAETRQIDAAEFVRRLESERLVIPLAMWPVTFVPLLEAAAQGQELPKNAAEAYELACLQLCTEKESDTLADPRDRSVEPRELIAVARRAAAVMQFCARDGLSTAVDDAANCVSLHELSQGTEPLDGGGVVACTEMAHRALTQCALLVAAGPEGRWAFAHRGFQEYLAARFLRAHATPIEVVRGIVLVGGGLTRQVASAQKDVAAWLALTDDKLFEDLLECAPSVLLLGDLSVRPEVDRTRVLNALVAAVRIGEDVEADYWTLQQLESSQLAGLITPLLADDEPPEVLAFALAVADACPHQELTGSLLSVAERNVLPDGLRSRAVNALVGPVRQCEADRLRALVHDRDPDVSARALDLLWPAYLTTAQLLEHLRAPEPDCLGHASVFINRLPNKLSSTDLPVALRWSRKQLAGGPDADDERWIDLAEVATRIIERAVKALQQISDVTSPLVEALADALLALAASPLAHDPRTGTEAVCAALDAHASTRRVIARAVLDRADERQVRSLTSSWPLRVFRGAHDSGYWAMELPSLPERAQGLLQAPLAAMPEEYEAWSAVYELAQHNPMLHEFTTHWYRMAIDDPSGGLFRLQRSHLMKQAAESVANRYDDAALRDALQAAHLQGSPRDAWRGILVCFYSSPEGGPVYVPEDLDITRAPSYPAQGSRLRAEVSDAARAVLARSSTVTVETVGPHGLNGWRDTPELTALALLVLDGQAVPELEPARWAGLATALLCGQTSREDGMLRGILLQLCAAKAAGLFETDLPQVLDRLAENWLTNTLGTLPRDLTAAQHRALQRWAAAPGRAVSHWRTGLYASASRGGQGGIDALRSAVSIPASRRRGGLDGAPVRRWIAAATTLMQIGDAASWPKILTAVEREPRLAPVLIRSFSAATTLGRWPLEPDQIGSADLGRLYRLMVEHLPGSGYVRPPNGSVGPEHDLARLRQYLPHNLAARGKRDAIDVLRELADSYPDDDRLRDLVLSATRFMTDQTWTPYSSVGELLKVAPGPTFRVINDEFQLRAAVLESLASVFREGCEFVV